MHSVTLTSRLLWRSVLVLVSVCELTLRLRRPWRSWCSSWRSRGSAGRDSRRRSPRTDRRSYRPRTARCDSARRAATETGGCRFMIRVPPQSHKHSQLTSECVDYITLWPEGGATGELTSSGFILRGPGPPEWTLNTIRGVYHADGLAGSHVVVVGVPPLEFWVLSMFQDVLLALEVGMVEADPGAALHTDGVHPEHTETLMELHQDDSPENCPLNPGF